MRSPKEIEQVAVLEPDMMGFICYKKSPRYIENLRSTDLNCIGASTLKVGVFVNEERLKVVELCKEFGFDFVQLHGNESATYCDHLRAHIPVIKAIAVDEINDLEAAKAYEGSVDYFLFDSKGKYFGGNGYAFDHGILDNYESQVPFLLSGGLGPGEVAQLLSADRWNQLVGLDLNSRVEINPGQKDIVKVQQAIELIRNGHK